MIHLSDKYYYYCRCCLSYNKQYSIPIYVRILNIITFISCPFHIHRLIRFIWWLDFRRGLESTVTFVWNFTKYRFLFGCNHIHFNIVSNTLNPKNLSYVQSYRFAVFPSAACAQYNVLSEISL